jgi:hypothetical protein
MNAGNDSRQIKRAKMPKDEPTGQRFTSWTRIWKPSQSTPFTTRTPDTRMRKIPSTLPEFSINQEPQPSPSNFRVFSKELDDSPHSSS